MLVDGMGLFGGQRQRKREVKSTWTLVSISGFLGSPFVTHDLGLKSIR